MTAPEPGGTPGTPVLDWSYGKTPTYDTSGRCLTCGSRFVVRREKGIKPPLSVTCPDCGCTEYSWRDYSEWNRPMTVPATSTRGTLRTETGRRLWAAVEALDYNTFMAPERAGFDDFGDALIAIEEEAARFERERLHSVLSGAANALALTVSTVPANGSRPHWCPIVGEQHDPTCMGMLKTQDDIRAARDDRTPDQQADDDDAMASGNFV